MIVALSRSSRKDAVTLTEHPFIPFDNEDDSLLFEKLQEHVLAHYPNPERKGCPDPAVLKSLIDNPAMSRWSNSMICIFSSARNVRAC